MKTSIESGHNHSSGSSVSDPDEIDEFDDSTGVDGSSAPRTLMQSDITSYTRPIQRKPRGSATSAARPTPRGFLGALRARELGRPRCSGGSTRAVLPSVSAASCGVGSSGAGPAWAGRLLTARVGLERIWLGAHNSGLTGGAALDFGVSNGRRGPSCMAFGGDKGELVAVGGPGPAFSIYDVDLFVSRRRGTPGGATASRLRTTAAPENDSGNNTANTSRNSDTECPILPFTVPRVSALGDNNVVDDEVSAIVFDPFPGSDEIAVALRRSATVRVFRLSDAAEAAENWANARRAAAAGGGNGGSNGEQFAYGAMGTLPSAPAARVLMPATTGRSDSGGHTSLLYDGESTSSSTVEPTMRGPHSRSIPSASSALIAGSAHGHIRLWPARLHTEGRSLLDPPEEAKQEVMKPTWTVQVKGIDGRPPAPVTALAWVGPQPCQPPPTENQQQLSPPAAALSSAEPVACPSNLDASTLPLDNNKVPEATAASLSSSSSSLSMKEEVSEAATPKRSAPLVGLAAARGLAKVPKTSGLSANTTLLGSLTGSQKLMASSATAKAGTTGGLKKAVGLKAAKLQGGIGERGLNGATPAAGSKALTGGLPGVKRALSETRSNSKTSSGSGGRLGGGIKMKAEQRTVGASGSLGSWLAPPPPLSDDVEKSGVSLEGPINSTLPSSSPFVASRTSVSVPPSSSSSSSTNTSMPSATAATKAKTKAFTSSTSSSSKSNGMSSKGRNSGNSRRRLLVAGSADGQITVWDCAQLTASKAFGVNACKQPLLVATLDAPHSLFRPIACNTAAFTRSNGKENCGSSNGNDKLRQLAEHSREWAGVLSLRSHNSSSSRSSRSSSSLDDHAALLTVGLRNGWVADFELSWNSGNSDSSSSGSGSNNSNNRSKGVCMPGGRGGSLLAVHSVRAAYLPSPPSRDIESTADSLTVQQSGGYGHPSWDQHGHCSGGVRPAPTALLQCSSATGASMELLLALPAAASKGAGVGDGGCGWGSRANAEESTSGNKKKSPFRPCLELLRATRRRRGGYGGNGEGGRPALPFYQMPLAKNMLAADGFLSAPLLKRGHSIADSDFNAASSLQTDSSLTSTNEATAPETPRVSSAYLPLKHGNALAVAPADPLLHRSWPNPGGGSHGSSHVGGGAAPVTALATHPNLPLALVAFDDGTAAMLLA